jgi:hypothetical protein
MVDNWVYVYIALLTQDESCNNALQFKTPHIEWQSGLTHIETGLKNWKTGNRICVNTDLSFLKLEDGLLHTSSVVVLGQCLGVADL